MQELRLVAVSEDGTYVVLAQPGRATRFSLPNDERLRAVARGQFARLAQYEIEVESPLRPKEIQARIRSGETAEQIADASGVPIERVRWFEGPVLAERAYIAQQAQTASVRRPGESGPGPRLGEIVAERLNDLGADPEEARWDSRKRADGSWLVELTSEADAEWLTAAWVFDPRKRHAMPEDDVASRLSLPQDVLEAAGLAVKATGTQRGRGTVTPFVPRAAPGPRPPAEPESRPEAQPVAASSLELEAEAATAGRRAARLPDPKPSPAELPRLQPPTRGTGRASATEPVTAQVSEPDSGRPDSGRPGPGRPDAGWPDARRPGMPADAPQRHAPPPASSAAPPATSPAAPPATSPAAPPAASAQPGAPAAGEEKQPAETKQDSPALSRPAKKAASGRGRRSSVPTWDEIMFGSSRRQD